MTLDVVDLVSKQKSRHSFRLTRAARKMPSSVEQTDQCRHFAQVSDSSPREK